MRSINRALYAVLAISIMFVYSTALTAQDPAKVASKNYKVLLENDKVRVLQFTGKMGDKIVMHSHPAYVTYFLADGKGKFTGSDGKTAERDIKKGEVLWHDAENHSVEIVSGDPQVLIIELKQ